MINSQFISLKSAEFQQLPLEQQDIGYRRVGESKERTAKKLDMCAEMADVEDVWNRIIEMSENWPALRVVDSIHPSSSFSLIHSILAALLSLTQFTVKMTIVFVCSAFIIHIFRMLFYYYHHYFHFVIVGFHSVCIHTDFSASSSSYSS